MYSIFISLYSENFRKNLIELGYPEDRQNQTKWVLADYINWMTNFTGEDKKKEEEGEK